jgi:hypothetical protein
VSLHDSSPPVDPEVRAARLIHLAATFRAFGEELASVGRVMGDPAARQFGEQHIGLGDWLLGLARSRNGRISDPEERS